MPREDTAVVVEVAAAQAEGGRGAAQHFPSEFGSVVGPDPVLDAARKIAFLPVVHGGLGLRSSEHTRHATKWRRIWSAR